MQTAVGRCPLLHFGQVERGHGLHGLAVGQVIQVAGGGGDGLVTEGLRDDHHVSTGLAEFVGVGVAQAVWVHPLGDARLGRVPLEHVADVPVGQLATVEGAEQRAVGQAQLLAGVQPAQQGVIGARVQRPDGGLVALAMQDAGGVALQVDVRGLQRQCLR